MKRTFNATISRIAPIVLAAALVAACDDDQWQLSELDPALLELRDEEKTEEHKPPEPPSPPGLDADEKDDLVKQGKGQKLKDVGPNDIKGHYIVQMKKGGNPKAAAAAVQATPKHVFTHVIPGFAGPLNKGQLKALEKRPDVELIEPFSDFVGHAGALVRDGSGVISGAADPRSDGTVAGW